MANIEERALNDKNVKIVDWKEYEIEFLYDENTDSYFTDVDEMVDVYRGYEKDMPKYAYGCHFIPFQLDVDGILESESDDHYDEILENIDGKKELFEAIEKFNKANEKNGSYYQDVMTIVKLD